MSKVRALDTHHKTAPSLDTPTDLSEEAVREISAKLNAILADSFALYLKTKNFHWHVSGPHFRDYHLLLDEQGEQIFATTDDIAERVRKIGGTTLRSISQIASLQRVKDNNADYRLQRSKCCAELRDDNKFWPRPCARRTGFARSRGCGDAPSLIEVWIDETERRTWFLFEATRSTPKG